MFVLFKHSLPCTPHKKTSSRVTAQRKKNTSRWEETRDEAVRKWHGKLADRETIASSLLFSWCGYLFCLFNLSNICWLQTRASSIMSVYLEPTLSLKG